MVSVAGHRGYGWGQAKVIALHDWVSDTSSYEPMLPYLDPEMCQWAFMDLRGYGLSRGRAAAFTLDEAAGDVLALADALGWQHFHLIGHSMTGMVIQRVAVHAPHRLRGLVGITPVSAAGQPLDDAQRANLKAMAYERTEAAALRAMWGDRLSEQWFHYKLRRWRETADAEASAAYVDMFSGPSFAEKVAGFDRPVLVLAGEHDFGPFTAVSLKAAFAPLYPEATFRTLAGAGHYPMQETPVLLATLIERFIFDTRDVASANTDQ